MLFVADVSCGGHDAASCTFCPPEESQGTEGGASYCNGDCVWHASTLSCTTKATEGIICATNVNKTRQILFGNNY